MLQNLLLVNLVEHVANAEELQTDCKRISVLSSLFLTIARGRGARRWLSCHFSRFMLVCVCKSERARACVCELRMCRCSRVSLNYTKAAEAAATTIALQTVAAAPKAAKQQKQHNQKT